MIVAAWFTLVGLIILAGFAMLGATFVHWYRQSKLKAAAEKQGHQ